MTVIKQALFLVEDDIDDHDNYSYNSDDDHEYFHIKHQSHQTNIVSSDDDDGNDIISCPLNHIPSRNQHQHHHGSTDLDQQNINCVTPDLPPPPPLQRRSRTLYALRSPEFLLLFVIALINFTVERAIPAVREWHNPFPTPSIHVSSVTITYFDISTASSTLSTNWDIGFHTENPSMKMACYSNLEASVYHRDAILSSTAMNPFCHEPGAKTALNATSYSSQMIVKDTVAMQILRDQKVDNPVAFTVKIKGMAQKCTGLSSETKYWSDATCQDKYYNLDVTCKDVHATVGKYWGKGRMSGEPKQCNVVVRSADRKCY